MSLTERLDKIRSPKLQNQRETLVVLSAIEDTLKDQQHGFTPTAYFAALLALLSQAIPSTNGIINKELASSVVYLLDLVTPHVPRALLRSKFGQILTSLAPALTYEETEAPLLKSSMGCLESLLMAQDSATWALPLIQVGPRRAVAGLLALAVDQRPKVRKRAQEALTNVLKKPPPSPSLDHPAADMCAETALRSLNDVAHETSKKSRSRSQDHEGHHPGLIHALQLVKTIALASGGWPSKKINTLCEALLNISRSSNEYLTIAAFEVFEIIFTGMADDVSSSKLPRLIETISELRPSQNDSQLLPPWIAIISRAYDVSSQLNPDETFLKLPEIFDMISVFLGSMSHNIRVSASECLISFLANCIPASVIIEPSVYDEKVLEKLAKGAINLLSVTYQAAWMEVFNVLSAMFEMLKWRSSPFLNDAIKTIGELRGNDSFNGKKEADAVLGKAMEAIGPETMLSILPLNLSKPKTGSPGRAWLFPILRDSIINTNLAHFRSEFVPLSETMFQRVVENEGNQKSMEIKIFETLVQQIWALLPGYCSFPLDLIASFDQSFAELLANVLYKQTELRADICKALLKLVETNKEILAFEEPNEDLILQKRITKADAQRNIDHLTKFSGNLLAVLFNVYSQTLPQYRGHILQCINAYLSITPEKELIETFARVTAMLEAALTESTSQTQADKQKQKQSINSMPPTSHTLMDLVITLSIYLPRSSFSALFSLVQVILPQSSDPQLQKKAYKLLPRLATSPTGVIALQERTSELQQLLLTTASSASAPCRRDRLAAISVLVSQLPPTSLHFIPAILSETVISAKEVNEKARTAAFDLLVLMGHKMQAGGTIIQSQIPHMPADAPVVNASLEEFFTMTSAGLAGSTPHMISASITALTRILYEFCSQLSDQVLEDLVATMDLFLTSNNREIVQSVLGFVKVAIISLPENIIRPRLESLVPGLMGWSSEHKARFRAKVKHILERMIRRFGFEIVDKYCPEADKKLVQNIRKTRERNKRKKDTVSTDNVNAEEENEENARVKNAKRRSHFASEFDQAIYGSDDTSSDHDNDSDDHDSSRPNKGTKTYIVEDSDEPLDLLAPGALAHISSSKPVKLKSLPSSSKLYAKAKTNLDGKLVLGGGGAGADSDDDDAMVLDFNEGRKKKEPGDGTLEGGIGAYVDAIRGRDAVRRGRGGKLKFSNRKEKEMEVDKHEEEEIAKAVREKRGGRGMVGPKGKVGRGGAGIVGVGKETGTRMKEMRNGRRDDKRKVLTGRVGGTGGSTKIGRMERGRSTRGGGGGGGRGGRGQRGRK